MASYHYDDSKGCNSCTSSCSNYVPLKKINTYECGPSCIDRYNSERSTKDIMDYNVFVLGKPRPNLPNDTSLVRKWSNHTYRENENL